MSSDPILLAGAHSSSLPKTPPAGRAPAAGRGRAADVSGSKDRPDFSRTLSHSKAAHRGAPDKAPPETKRAALPGAGGKPESAESPAQAKAQRRPDAGAHRVQASESTTAKTNTASAAPGLTRRWLLRAADQAPTAKPVLAGPARADQPSQSTVHLATGPTAARSPVHADVRHVSTQGYTQRQTEIHDPRTKNNDHKKDGADDTTNDAALALALITPNLIPPQIAAGSSGAARAAGHTADHAVHGQRPNAIPSRAALAQMLATANGQTAADAGARAAAGPGSTAVTPPDAQLRPAIEALVRFADNGASAGATPARPHVDATGSTNPTQASAPVSNAGALSGPNAAVAGGAANPTAMPANPGIGAPLGSEAWNTALGQHTLRLAADGSRQARIQLHPRELGQINISVTVNDHNQAQLHLASAHAHVRDAVEAALPQLKQSLAAGGLTLGQASVGDQNSQAGFGNNGARGQSGRGRQSPDDGPTIEAIDEALPVSAAHAGAGLRGGIDIFA